MFANPREAVEAVRRATENPGIAAALRVAEEALERFPDEPELSARRAELLLAGGRLGEARAQIQRAGHGAPNNSEVLAAHLAVCCYDGSLDEAEWVLCQFDQESLSRTQLLSSAKFYRLVGEREKMLENLRRLQDRSSADPEVLRAVATSPEVPTDWAIESRNLLLTRFANTVAAYQVLAEDACSSQDWQAAEDSYRKALAIAPESPAILAELSTCLLRQGRADEAEKAARESMRLNSQNPAALSVLAGIAQEQGNLAEADAYHRQAAKAIPGQRGIGVIKQASALAKHRKWQEAGRLYESLLSAPGGVQAFARKRAAVAYLQSQDWRGLQRILNFVADEEKSAPEIIEAHAGLLDSMTQTDDAASQLEKGWDRHPNKARLATALVLLLSRYHQETRAGEIANRAAESIFDDPETWMDLVATLDRLGFSAQSEKLLRTGRATFPRYEGWKGQVDECHSESVRESAEHLAPADSDHRAERSPRRLAKAFGWLRQRQRRSA